MKVSSGRAPEIALRSACVVGDTRVGSVSISKHELWVNCPVKQLCFLLTVLGSCSLHIFFNQLSWFQSIITPVNYDPILTRGQISPDSSNVSSFISSSPSLSFSFNNTDYMIYSWQTPVVYWQFLLDVAFPPKFPLPSTHTHNTLLPQLCYSWYHPSTAQTWVSEVLSPLYASHTQSYLQAVRCISHPCFPVKAAVFCLVYLPLPLIRLIRHL